MNARFAETIRRRGYSKDSLARELKAKWPEVFKGIEPRSLGVKIGELGRGVTTWWSGRPDRLDALRELTSFDAAELVKARAQQARGRWSFPEFPTLPPLDLLEELPAELCISATGDPLRVDMGIEPWMQRTLPTPRRPPRVLALSAGVTWLKIPAGGGLDLLLARLKAVGDVEVLAADTLEEAVTGAFGGGQPIVLAPQRAPTPDDLESLMLLDPTRPVLVISASACPHPEQPSDSAWLPRWEWLTTTGSARRRLDLVKGHQGGLFGDGGVNAFEMRLAPDWRMTLIDWIEQRLEGTGDTLFSRQGLSAWLQRFDPTSVWFSKPADVMALASLCHASGERKLPNPDSAEAGARLLRQLAPMDSRSESLLSRLVDMRWQDTAHDWVAPLPWDAWLDLVEAQSRDAPEDRSAKTRRKRTPALDLEELRKEGFLAPDSSGWWTFAQPVQARLVLRDALTRWVSAGDLERWARPLVGDSSRQAALDSVLGSMPTNALDRSIKSVLQAAPDSLSALSAAEALFLVMGRKFASDQATYTPELAGLHERFLQLHADADGHVLPPLTREPGENSETPLPWLLACWEWSLCTPPPPVLPPSLVDWFPGWLPQGGDADGAWFTQLPAPLREPSAPFAEVIVGIDETVKAAQRVVDRIGFRSLIEQTQMGSLWAVLMLTAAGRGQVAPMASWWDTLFRSREAPDHLIRSFAPGDADAVATRLLPSLLEAAAGSDSFTQALALRGPVWRWLFGQSRASTVVPRLLEPTVSRLYGRFRALPPDWRLALEERLDLSDPDAHWEMALSESENPEALVHRILSGGATSPSLLQMLWRLAPGPCLAHGCNEDDPMSWLLIHFCPPEQSGRLADEIARRDGLWPDRPERLAWVLRRLRESRGQVASLRALLDRLGLR